MISYDLSYTLDKIFDIFGVCFESGDIFRMTTQAYGWKRHIVTIMLAYVD